jgi:hypothetical protein
MLKQGPYCMPLILSIICKNAAINRYIPLPGKYVFEPAAPINASN